MTSVHVNDALSQMQIYILYDHLLLHVFSGFTNAHLDICEPV